MKWVLIFVFIIVHKDDAFCINGIEIDLKELEELEQRVAAKRLLLQQQQQIQPPLNDKILFCEESDRLEESFEKSLKISDRNSEAVIQSPSLATMFFVITSIVSILNQIFYLPTIQKS